MGDLSRWRGTGGWLTREIWGYHQDLWNHFSGDGQHTGVFFSAWCRHRVGGRLDWSWGE